MNGQILERTQCVARQHVEACKGIAVAAISDCMRYPAATGPRLRPMHRLGYLAGPALTVKALPGDNLMIHKALAIAQPGDVIVVDAGGELANALVGELMVMTAISRGLAGIVLNGAVRDLDVIGTGSFPVYAAGVSIRGPRKESPGVINAPVTLDGMLVNPGDLMVGDADGWVCVPCGSVAEVLAAARETLLVEKKKLADIAAGVLDVTWIDEKLNGKITARRHS